MGSPVFPGLSSGAEPTLLGYTCIVNNDLPTLPVNASSPPTTSKPVLLADSTSTSFGAGHFGFNDLTNVLRISGSLPTWQWFAQMCLWIPVP